MKSHFLKENDVVLSSRWQFQDGRSQGLGTEWDQELPKAGIISCIHFIHSNQLSAMMCVCSKYWINSGLGSWVPAFISCGRLNNGSPKCQHANPWNLEYVVMDITWKKGFSDMTKSRILRWREHLGLSRWAQWTHRSSYERSQ